MAITRVYEPFSLVPAYNDIEFVSLSNQVAQPNFVYYVLVTAGSDTYVYKVPPGVNNECNFNARAIAEKYVRNYYPYQINGWTEILGGFKSITVNIGESYGTTPVIYPGTNKIFNVWNGSLTLKSRRTYRSNDYTQAATWLNNYTPFTGNYQVPTVTIDRNHDLPFTFLDASKIIDKVVITTLIVTSSSFSIVTTATVTNSTAKEFISINLSPTSINALLSGSPPFNGTENGYLLDFYITTAVGIIQKSAFISIQAPCPVSVVNNNRWVFYLNKLGAYDFIDTILRPQKGLNISRTYYKSPIDPLSQASSYYVVGAQNQDGVNPLQSGQKVLSATYERVDTLNSEWLTNKQIDDVADLFTTSSVFIQEAANDYVIKSPTDTYYEYGNEYIDKNGKLVMKFSSVNTEGSQHE